MENQIAVWVAAGIFVLAVASSFIRVKLKGASGSEKKMATLRSQRDEMFEYFGIERGSNARLLDSLDLGPLEMISSGTARQGKGGRKRR